MGIPIPGMFQKYGFETEKASVACQIFTTDQEQYLQNELAEIAEQKMSIAYDPDNPGLFAFQHEFYRGQIELIKYLLTKSEAAKNSIVTDFSAPT